MPLPSPPPNEPTRNEPLAQAGQAPRFAPGAPYPHPHPQDPYAQAHAHPRSPHPQVPPRPVPLIDGKELRPRARWYWIGGLTIPIGGLAAFLVFLGLLLSATAEPELIAEFEGGDSAAFQVEEGQEGYWGLYVEGDANRFACELDTPAGPGYGNDNLDTAPHSYSGMAYDSWRLTAELSTPEPGEYVLRCDDLHSGTYGIGTLEQTASSEAKLITGTLVLVVLGPLSFIAGVVVLIVTGVRRASHRTRLVRERTRTAGAPWPPGPGPQPGFGPQPGARPEPPQGPRTGPPEGAPQGPRTGPPPGGAQH